MNAIVLTVALTLTAQVQLPAPRHPDPPTLKEQRQENLENVVARRKAVALRKQARRAIEAQIQANQSRARAAWEAEMAPTWAAQQAEANRQAIESRKADALMSMAGSAAQQTLIDRQRLRYQSQALGVPQVPSAEGMVPYGYGSAGLLPR